jgi:hypothetical protein
MAQYLALTVHGSLGIDATILRTILGVEKTSIETRRLKNFQKYCPKPELLAPYKTPKTKSRRGYLTGYRTITKWLGKLGGGKNKPTQNAGKKEPEGKPSQNEGKGDKGTEERKDTDKPEKPAKPTPKEQVKQALKTYDLTPERLQPRKLDTELKMNDREWIAATKSGNLKKFSKSEKSERLLAKYRCVQALQAYVKAGRTEVAQYFGLRLHGWRVFRLAQLASLLGMEENLSEKDYQDFKQKCGNPDALRPVGKV